MALLDVLTTIVPIELKDKLQAELGETESQSIIAKVTQLTD